MVREPLGSSPSLPRPHGVLDPVQMAGRLGVDVLRHANSARHPQRGDSHDVVHARPTVRDDLDRSTGISLAGVLTVLLTPNAKLLLAHSKLELSLKLELFRTRRSVP
uniref:(northern house mosquito) hypothetical protein n=1 Tax=Culex pipiens TaxID=7175 RepID=A0A8D8EUD6_CULPI